MIQVDLRKYFTRAAVVQYLTNAAPIKSPVLDLLYPEAKRRNWPLPIIGIEEITKIIRNVPVIRRGTPAYPISDGALDIAYIEPQPVEVSDFISAAEFNNLQLLEATGLEQYINNKFDFMRNTIRKTAEALAGQSLLGSISYPLKIQGGYSTYSVIFGATLEFVLSKLWSVEGKTLQEILMDFVSISELLNDQGYGSSIAYLAGSEAFVKLAGSVLALQSNGTIAARVNENSISIAGFTVQLFNGSYINPETNVAVKYVDNKKICAVALDAPFQLIYCALDDMEAGLQPLPFWASQETKKNPSGVEILGKSKPLPVPVPKAICWATVLA